MRKVTSIIFCACALSLTSATAAYCAADQLQAAPPIPASDRQKEPPRAPKLLTLTPEQQQVEFKQLQQDILAKPNDAQLHYKLGEALRKAGQKEKACEEYLKAINLDQTLWVAYHQLTTNSSDEKQLDHAMEKLSKLENEKPRELLLRVALSELYEKRGNYYQAARTLVDLTYTNSVPEKWRPKVNARIHNMLVLSKTTKLKEDVPQSANGSEEDLDLMPAPLPTPQTKRSIAQAKLKDSKEVRGMGHTPLVP